MQTQKQGEPEKMLQGCPSWQRIHSVGEWVSCLLPMETSALSVAYTLGDKFLWFSTRITAFLDCLCKEWGIATLKVTLGRMLKP